MTRSHKPFELRVADDADLAQVDRLDQLRTGSPTSTSIRDTLSPSAKRLLVAAVGGDVVGYAVVGRLFAYDFLELLFVAPDHRRAGVAGRLVAAVAEAATSTRLFTSTNRSNEPMQRLCDRLGFAPCGVVEGLDEGDPELFYVMRL